MASCSGCGRRVISLPLGLGAGTQRASWTESASLSRKLNANNCVSPLIFVKSPLVGTLFSLRASHSFSFPIDFELAEVVASRDFRLPTDVGTDWTNELNAVLLKSVD